MEENKTVESVAAKQQPMPEEIPSVIKSHLPAHLRPRKPLEQSKVINQEGGSTPAVVKRKQVTRWFNSPTDSVLSPCTKKLLKPAGHKDAHPNQVKNEVQKALVMDEHAADEPMDQS